MNHNTRFVALLNDGCELAIINLQKQKIERLQVLAKYGSRTSTEKREKK
jgi:hypothetical protein